MSKGLNKVTLIGNLGRDPEVRYTQDGKAIANISIATSESWKDKNGQKVEKVEWHRIVFFGKLAEVVGDYLVKGSKIYLEGKIRTRKWADNNTGEEKYTTEIHGEDLVMLDSPDHGGGGKPEHPDQRNPDDNYLDPNGDIPF